LNLVNFQVNLMNASDDSDRGLVATGRLCAVFHVIRANGRMLAREFLAGIPNSTRARFHADFQYLCDNGMLPGNRLWKLRGRRTGVREFRVQKRYRIGTFEHEGRWLLTHGFEKRGQGPPPGEIERIERIRGEYLARQERRRKEKR
jgi:hypothetical protein